MAQLGFQSLSRFFFGVVDYFRLPKGGVAAKSW